MLVLSIACLMAICFVNCQQPATDVEESAAEAEGMSAAEQVARGAYLVNTMGCDDCHTPKVMGEMGPEPDMTRRFMGHPAGTELPDYDPAWVAPGQWYLANNDLTGWVGPWGISYSANISSDATGIGSWTEEHFIRAIREGLYKGLEGSRPLLPPMPWPQYRQLTDEDLKAIFAFLQTTEPQNNVVPPAVVAGPPPG